MVNLVRLAQTIKPTERGELMEFNAGNIQEPWEMLERWDNIPCTCDPDVGHLCEICHDTEVVLRLMGEAMRKHPRLPCVNCQADGPTDRH